MSSLIPAHQDTGRMVRAFSAALADKLARAELKYGYTNGWLTNDWEPECRAQLAAHVVKGDPLDVAAYAAFCWARGWSTANGELVGGREEAVVAHDSADGPRQIWLEPSCCCEDRDERLWSPDGFEECGCEDPKDHVRYVRADLAAPVLASQAEQNALDFIAVRQVLLSKERGEGHNRALAALNRLTEAARRALDEGAK